MKILITTGIYPPKIGGPAKYAANLEAEFKKNGHEVVVRTYTIENKLPPIIRHLFFFLKIIPGVVWADATLSLDTFSVGVPTIFASKIFGKKSAVRIGGDFLWEQYLERTKKKVLLRNFYISEKNSLSLKEKLIFKITKIALKYCDIIVFSTGWQKDIWISPYEINENTSMIIENHYEVPESEGEIPTNKIFISSSRKIFLKNIEILDEVFELDEIKKLGGALFSKNLPHNDFLEKIRNSYAVIVPSISEVSPNLILEAIKFGKPFICTREVGIYDRIKDVGLYVDPLSENEIKDAVMILLTKDNYDREVEKIKNFNFTHPWSNIAGEFELILKI